MDRKDELDYILKKAKKIGDIGAKKTESIIRVSKYKLQCIKLDEEIRQKYMLLGKLVYKMVKSETEDTDRVAQLAADIDYLHKKLRRYRGFIEQARKIIICPVCGEANKLSDIFCTNCKARIVFTDEEPDEYDDYTATASESADAEQ